MEKIYLVYVDGLYDDFPFSELFAYKNKQNAIDKMNELIEKDKEENSSWYDNDKYVIERTDYLFSIYEDGEYLLNHYDITITEVELN